MATAKKGNERQSFKWTPETSWFFWYFSYISYISLYFSNSVTIKLNSMKLQNIYVILYNKMELTQPFWRLIKNYMIKTITFYQGLQLIFSLHPGSRQKGILFEFLLRRLLWIFRSSQQRCLQKKVVLKFSQIQRKTPVLQSPFQ